MMEAYFAIRMEAGKLNYNTVFAIVKYQQFQDEVNAILAADGYIINSDGTVTKQ